MDDASDRAVFTASAKALRTIAVDRGLRDMIRSSPTLLHALEKAAWRFVAGPDRQSALRCATELHSRGILSSIDFQGEDAEARSEVDAAVDEFVEATRATASLNVGASISLNLSHIGLAIDRALAVANCERILAAATPTGTEVLLNMEGDRYREDILSIYLDLAPRFSTFGITLQACLSRTERDLEMCLEVPGRIRLVKGAYDELGHGTDIRSGSVDAQYRRLAQRLIESGHACAIATHDPSILAGLLATSARRPEAVEFEMLFSVATHRLEKLRDLGRQVRVYLPYGHKWHLYLFHRLAEHPPNLHVALTAMVKELQAR